MAHQRRTDTADAVRLLGAAIRGQEERLAAQLGARNATEAALRETGSGGFFVTRQQLMEVIPVDAVLVLNADLGPLHRVTVRHAIRMLCRRVAVVHESEPDIRIGVFPMPKVLRLVSYVVTRWRYTKGPTWSRAGVLRRDGHRCAYCGNSGYTIDHILPSSRGGKNSWLNTVAACAGCNQRKGDRTPAEAGMRLRLEPKTPSWYALATR